MDAVSRAAFGALALLCVAAAAYPLVVVSGGTHALWYSAVAVAASLLAFGGLAYHRPPRRGAWALVIGGFAGWVLGDLVYMLEQNLWRLHSYPVPSDAFYLASYLVLGAGTLAMVRTRPSGRDLTALLDAMVIAVGAGVVATVFVIAPLAEDSSLSLAGRLVSSAYPVADLVVLAILVRLWTTPGARTASFRLLTAAVGTTLLADGVWNVWVVTTGETDTSPWNDVLWLVSYLLLGAATWSRSMRVVSERPPGRQETATRRRLVLLACGLMLPAAATLIDGAGDGEVLWPVLAGGSLAMSLLVLMRMAGLLSTVQVQAVRLAALARSDALTGAPNRRTWDHELSRACHNGREQGTPLCVALLDLDHFKAYNDSHGHQAGDRLLREAVATWTERLEGDGLVARYGGEEFAVLLPGHTAQEARQRLDDLRSVTPQGQTFSAGVARWEPGTEPGLAVAWADEALYDAKRSGRDRVMVWQRQRGEAGLPTLRIALQPIVSLRTGRQVAVEALSRFDGRSPLDVIEQARRDGSGSALEAAAVRAALAHRSRDRVLSINISLPALFSPEVLEALPRDLSGVVLEITETSDAGDEGELCRLVDDLRRRGARIAVDDWGKGFSNLDRILRLRPEAVKVDMSLVQNLDSPYHRAAIRAITAWADEVGATICAEGIENEQQWRILQDLGVHTGQGYFIGSPAVPSSTERAASAAREP